MVVNGEIVVNPDADDFFLPREEALAVVKAFMEIMKAKESVGTGHIEDLPVDADELFHVFAVYYHAHLEYDRACRKFKIRPGFESKFVERTSALKYCMKVVGKENLGSRQHDEHMF